MPSAELELRRWRSPTSMPCMRSTLTTNADARQVRWLAGNHVAVRRVLSTRVDRIAALQVEVLEHGLRECWPSVPARTARRSPCSWCCCACDQSNVARRRQRPIPFARGHAAPRPPRPRRAPRRAASAAAAASARRGRADSDCRAACVFAPPLPNVSYIRSMPLWFDAMKPR